MRLLCVLGTRPEIIKTATVIKAAEEHPGVELAILHTGQHYDYRLDKIFFEELSLSEPQFMANAGNKTYGAQLKIIIQAVEEASKQFKPDVILGQGDTTSVYGAALAASKLQIPFAHQEAGLRSKNLAMLEEKHRITSDILSTYLFPPTSVCVENLHNELITENIFVCGNSIVDAVNLYAHNIDRQAVILDKLKLKKGEFFLVTAHRRETIGSRDSVEKFVNLIRFIQKKFQDFQIVFPMHPHTKSVLHEFGLQLPTSVLVIEPLGFVDMLALEECSRVILTDSGGVQEESVVLQKPCITLRTETERPETLAGGMNVVTGLEEERVSDAISDILNGKKITWSSPFGCGTTGKIIIETLYNFYEDTHDN